MFAILFTAFTWPFWVLVLTWLALEIICTEKENGWLTGFTFIGFLAFLTAFTDVNVIAYAAHHFDLVLLGILVYGAVGIFWGVVKWYFFVHNRYQKYSEKEAKYKADYQEYLKPLTPAMDGYGLKSPPTNPLSYKDWLIDRGAVPSALKNKALIIFWMSYWPFSATWTLINDPVRAFYRFVYARLAKTYDNIVDHVFGF